MLVASDYELADRCRQEGRILVTLDLDFADIQTYPPKAFPGRIVLRPRLQDRDHVISIVARLIRLVEEEPLANRLWIVEEDRIRIRS